MDATQKPVHQLTYDEAVSRLAQLGIAELEYYLRNPASYEVVERESGRSPRQG